MKPKGVPQKRFIRLVRVTHINQWISRQESLILDYGIGLRFGGKSILAVWADKPFPANIVFVVIGILGFEWYLEFRWGQEGGS